MNLSPNIKKYREFCQPNEIASEQKYPAPQIQLPRSNSWTLCLLHQPRIPGGESDVQMPCCGSRLRIDGFPSDVNRLPPILELLDPPTLSTDC